MKDLTESLQTISDANDEWRTTFDAMDEAIALLDAEGTVLRCNRAMAEFAKKSFSEIIGQACKEMCICLGGHREQCPIIQCRTTLQRESMVFNQGEKWFKVSADPIVNEVGQLQGIVHILQDITEQKQLEIALRKSEERFRLFFEAANDAMFIVDMEGKLLDLNRTAYKRLGYTREEMIGKRVSEIDSPEFAPKVPQRMAQIAESGNAVFESAHIATDGTVMPVEINAKIIDYAGQKMVLSVVRDITWRKEAEMRLRQSEERYRLLFQKSPIGVFQYDCDLRITDCNDRFIEILGSSREKLTNLDMKTLHDQRVIAPISAVLHGGEGIYEGQYLATTSNANINIYMRTAPMMDPADGITGGIGIVEDISKRVRIERQLQEQQMFSQSLIQNSAIATFVLDAQHTVLIWNRACEELTKIPAAEMVGTKEPWKAFYDRERPVIADIVLAGETEKLASLYPLFSQSLYARDGLHAEGWLSLRGRDCYLVFDAAPIRDGSGATIAAIETLQDMTEHKLAEEALRESEERYRSVVENAFDMIQSIAPDGRILYVNPAWLRTMGYTTEELLNRTIFDIIHPSCQSKCSSVFSRLNSGSPVEHFETQFRSRDGRIIDVEGSASVNMVEGRVKSMQCLLHDVTERKRLEEELFRSQQDWEYTFNSITDMVTVHDRDFNIILANKAAEKILGLPILEKVKDRKCFSYYHGTDSAPSGCPSCGCLISAEPASFEVFEPHLNMFIEIRAIPRFDSSNNIIGLIHVVRDITERKKAESERERLHQEKEHLREQLLQSQKMEAVGTLAGGIAHDFNNILNVIIGYGGLLDNMPDMSGKAKGFLAEITSAANRAAHLTRGLLAFSRKQHLELKPADLNDIIRSITAMLHRVIGEDIRMNIELCRESLVIVCDAMQVEQIVVNLASNARDAMPSGGQLTLRTEVAELDEESCPPGGFSRPGRYAVMQLTDTGVGMTEETRERIFEPFFTTKAVGKGTGLGLSIIYGIVAQHRGFLECKSEPGHGTVFTIYLPLAVRSDIGEEEREKKEYAAKGRGELILIAEDDESGRRLVRVLLEHQGYRVIEAANGIEVIEKFREHAQDIELMLLDVIMPDMNGYDALELIKEQYPRTRAILMSGYTADILEQRGIKDVPVSLLKKPISPHELLRVVHSTLASDNRQP